MSLIHEGDPRSLMGEQVKFEPRPTEQEVLAQKRRLVRIALESDISFTEKQLNILRLRRYFEEEGPQPSFRELEEAGVLEGNTFQAASDMEVAIFRRISKKTGIEIGNAREITPQEREFIQQNPNLSTAQGAKALRRSMETIGKLKDELGIPIMKAGGGPKAVIPHETLEELYVNQRLNSSAVGEIVGYGEKVVRRNLKEQGMAVRQGYHGHSRKQS